MADNHHILINRKSYFSKFKEIDSYFYVYPDDQVVEFIHDLSRSEYFKMPGGTNELNDNEFILCEPDGTRFNQKVRDTLDEYGIIYDAIII